VNDTGPGPVQRDAPTVSLVSAPTPARAHRALDVLHSLIYFAPEIDEEFTRVGLRPGRMPYFASRSAPMGAVPPAVTVATFYNFNPALVAKYLPRAWTLATPEDVLGARVTLADRALSRLLGDAVAGAEVVEAAELAREATTALMPEGRALYAGHAALPWPDEPHLVLWHAATLLREYRGDGHVAALTRSGLSGLDAVVTHTLTGYGFTAAAAKHSRGWSDAEWDTALASLADRGLVADGALTSDGQAVREAIEADTDAMDTAAWDRLGPERTARLIELGRGLSRTAIAAGAFPSGVLARG
jgi:hypothetical protein